MLISMMSFYFDYHGDDGCCIGLQLLAPVRLLVPLGHVPLRLVAVNDSLEPHLPLAGVIKAHRSTMPTWAERGGGGRFGKTSGRTAN